MPHSRSYALFLKIALSASKSDVVWPPRSCDLTPLDYYFWGADKPETIDALKDNIHEVIDEIPLHTIDNVLKNWTDRVDYCMASRESYLKDCTFK